MIRISWLLLFFVVRDVMAVQEFFDHKNTMCDSDEDIYISCTFAKTERRNSETVASVCAKNNLSPIEGYVQYRYGVPEKEPEFVYPKKKVPPKGVFELLNVGEVSLGVGRYLQFFSEGYLYSFERKGLEGYWLVVRGAKGEVFNRYCDAPGKTYLSDKVRQGIGS